MESCTHNKKIACISEMHGMARKGDLWRISLFFGQNCTKITDNYLQACANSFNLKNEKTSFTFLRIQGEYVQTKLR